MPSMVMFFTGLLLVAYASSDKNRWRWFSNFILLLLSAVFISSLT